jgi:hypothetical protein
MILLTHELPQYDADAMSGTQFSVWESESKLALHMVYVSSVVPEEVHRDI